MVVGVALTNGNIDADPAFLRLPDDGGDGWGNANDDFGNLHLGPGSPCIDAANNAYVPAGVTTDLDGAPRFHDDPKTPDTGSGSPPVVDMGCYEFRLGDCDNSGQVTLADVAGAMSCLQGPEVTVSPDCACFDLDASDKVDLRDMALLQLVFSQP